MRKWGVAVSSFRMMSTGLLGSVLLAGILGLVAAPPAGAATATFTSQAVGTSGSTASFTMSGPWTMSWSYNCSSYGTAGYLGVTVNQPAGDPALDDAPNELGMSGSGTDYYYDTGTFSLSIVSQCDWSITVSPSAAGPLGTPATFTNGSIGLSGTTQQFSIAAPWTMTWSYNCSNYGSSGIFAVYVNQPAGDSALDIGPSELGTSGSGTDSYTDSGIFNLDILSECDWSITVSASAGAPPPPQHGYWLVGADGGIFTFGSARFYGSTGSLQLQRPVVGITPTADRGGYWLVASDGGIFTFGDAGFYGSIPGLGIAPAGTPGVRALSAPIVGMVPSADGGGYFMVGADGGVFAFGDARFAGSCPGIGGCAGAAVAVMPDASGNGYWLVTASGHVYTFGDATYYGAPGPQSVPVTSAVRTPDGRGYWILFANGAVAAFGDAANLGGPLGSVGGFDPATAIFATADGGGYWVASAAGAAYPFGDAPNDGDMAGQHLNAPVIAATGW